MFRRVPRKNPNRKERFKIKRVFPRLKHRNINIKLIILPEINYNFEQKM